MNTSLYLAAATGGTWLDTALSNTENLVRVTGGAILGVMGLIVLVMAGIRASVKVMSKESGGGQNTTSWGRIVIMLLVGGALLSTGLALIITLATGSTDTINDLGGAGAILPLLGL